MSVAVVWFRRDLRVHDNPALDAARGAADRVACLFVVEQRWLTGSPHRSAYLAASVDALADELARRGASLALRLGPAASAVPAFAREADADVVFAAADVTPRAIERDRAVQKGLEQAGARLEHTEGLFVREPGRIASNSGDPYRIFTPFHRRWLEQPLRDGAPTPRALDGADLPSDAAAERALAGVRADTVPPVGERAGRAAMRRFLRAGGYDENRHRLDGSGGSVLSAAFRFGAVSPVLAAREGPAPWARQLAWRDFASETALHHPALLSRSLRAPKRAWSKDARALDEWRTGGTGEPVIDAAMRQLAAEGWISNRARMTVGSFLCRDLGIDWREGARHFMRLLVDGDPSVNAFNWQWVAGTGFDAPAPFWRLSPERQAQRHDPGGRWLGRWADQ